MIFFWQERKRQTCSASMPGSLQNAVIYRIRARTRSVHDVQIVVQIKGLGRAGPCRASQVQAQLLARLRQHPQLAGRLTPELDEDQLPEQGVLESLTQQLRELGFDLALQHFGGRFSMIGNLARLGLAHLKVDGSYLRHRRGKRQTPVHRVPCSVLPTASTRILDSFLIPFGLFLYLVLFLLLFQLFRIVCKSLLHIRLVFGVGFF